MGKFYCERCGRDRGLPFHRRVIRAIGMACDFCGKKDRHEKVYFLSERTHGKDA